MNRWEALLLAALFCTQFLFTSTSVRLGYASMYCVLASIILITDVPKMRTFFGAARETWTGTKVAHAGSPHTGPP
jgi:hypothetical protein